MIYTIIIYFIMEYYLEYKYINNLEIMFLNFYLISLKLKRNIYLTIYSKHRLILIKFTNKKCVLPQDTIKIRFKNINN